MRTAILCLSLLIAVSSKVAATQAPVLQLAATTSGPKFEVATIKPSDPNKCCARYWQNHGHRFAIYNANLRWLIRMAYGLNDKQIIGGPTWMDGGMYDVSGEIEGSKSATDTEWRVAVQKLLADRCQLRFHHENREMSAYALVRTKDGPNLVRDTYQEPLLEFSGNMGETMRAYGRDVTLQEYIGEMQRLLLDRPVVDRTGITGTFDFYMRFTREDPYSLGMMELPDNAAPNLRDALQRQLGLKLEPTKASVDVLVIDRVEKPSPN